jgi:hypothetical protein
MIIATQDELFRAAGVSRGKTLALRDLAAKTLDGTVPTLAKIRRMSDEDIIEHLTQVRGIGPWTVEMLLIFRLGRPDVLPVSDYGVRKGLRAHLPPDSQEQAVLERPAAKARRDAPPRRRNGVPGDRWRAGICGGPAIWRGRLRRRRISSLHRSISWQNPSLPDDGSSMATQGNSLFRRQTPILSWE